MRRKYAWLFVALFVAGAHSHEVLATVPSSMTIQGKLTDAAGSPLPAGPKTLTFKIFDDPVLSDGQTWPVGCVESEVINTGADGLFSWSLGTDCPLTDTVFGYPFEWLEITVDAGSGPIVLPRVFLNTSPFSFRVGTVDQAAGGDIYGDVHLHSDLTVGQAGDPGNLYVQSSTGADYIHLDGTTGRVSAISNIQVVDATTGDLEAVLLPGAGGGGIRTYDESNFITLNGGSASTGGFIDVYRGGVAGLGVRLDGEDGDGGEIFAYDGTGVATFHVDADADGVGAGAQLFMSDGTQNTISISANAGEGGAGVSMYASTGVYTVEIDADEADAGVIRLYDEGGQANIVMQAAEAAANGAQIALYDAGHAATIVLDAEPGTGPGTVTTQVLQITGGADFAEKFDVNASMSGTAPEPGMVVCIDPDHAGRLVVSEGSYCKAVAGIISGAGGVIPGMVMAQEGSVAHGEFPVALTGRVYVMADASNGAIGIGDMLTTSETPGHAMRASDLSAAQGAIIGKSMTRLEAGCGLVLVLVNLQ